ncbi:hypothetical protein GWN63_02610, partial [Candidatus Bathyarchaeota archaeon]|nr:hypothetical protein [Candidatus Bathyarchaeota archaeon]NIR14524.1 hypothetical protein [Desulfobacterales bacterium]NIU81122.1 hypothetical protein [Candidatus Bathyarchaeota archaeon]NIV67751.1 hypothetical protein [Candidatus Bathyarchaeota archaeon]
MIGVGSQEGKAKLSLFDVSNVTKPLETAKYLVPGLWSDTPVLRDH